MTYRKNELQRRSDKREPNKIDKELQEKILSLQNEKGLKKYISK